MRYLVLLGIIFLACTVYATIRFIVVGQAYYFFMVFNLALAFVPLVLSIGYSRVFQEKKTQLKTGLLVFLSVPWLLFLPNSSYVFTDFIHLIQRGLISDNPNERGPNMLVWYDVTFKSAFAFVGHLAGLISMITMHQLWTKYFNKVGAWVAILAASLATGYGVFIGRFERLNSWTVVTRPDGAIKELFSNLFTWDALVFTLGWALFIFISFFFLYIFRRYSAGPELDK